MPMADFCNEMAVLLTQVASTNKAKHGTVSGSEKEVQPGEVEVPECIKRLHCFNIELFSGMFCISVYEVLRQKGLDQKTKFHFLN